MPRRELEAKFAVQDAAAQVVVGSLTAGLDLSFEAEVWQRDWVYAADADTILNQRRGTTIARVREEPAGTSLTVKVRRTTDLDRSEFEVRVDDGAAARQILTALGLYNVVTVRKVRRGAHMASGVSVLVDEVEELGTFVEIEVLERDDVGAAEQRLGEIVQRVVGALGDRLTPVAKGYDRLLLEK